MNTINTCLLTASLALASLTTQAQTTPTFISYPTLTPDGQTIVFSYAGDLWKVAPEGGQALRLTAMRGDEIAPRVSPDGQWLAFSPNPFGNHDVYMMPLAGAALRQPSPHATSDEVDTDRQTNA